MTNKGLSILIICLTAGIAIMFIVLWCTLHGGISDIKKQTRMQIDSIGSKKSRASIQIEFANYDKKHVLIDPTELEKINTHVKDLTDEVQRESNRAESIIDKDLDRLNLYMAIGIGFMTLFGVFIPLLINVLTVQDVRDKQKDLETKLKDKAAELKSTSDKITKIGEKTDAMLPDVCNLILQTAIARFFNVGSIVLTEAVMMKNYDSFINLFKAIKSAFTVCKETQNHVITDNFIHTIEDFVHFLKQEQSKSGFLFDTRASNKEFEELIATLVALKGSTSNNRLSSYEAVEKQIDAIMELLKSKNVLRAA